MGAIRNLLALFGLVSLVVFIVLFNKFGSMYGIYSSLDGETKAFLAENMEKLQAMGPEKVQNYVDLAKQFDGKSYDIYMEMADTLLKTGKTADATIWKIPVEEGLSVEEVEETMKFVANEHNFSNVGELPLYKDVEAKLGTKFRFIKMYLFCDSLVAAKMLSDSDAFSAYFPCRITLVEDTEGKLWLYTLNMDMMIHGGRPLPDDLLTEALRVKEIMLDIMKRGSTGEF